MFIFKEFPVKWNGVSEDVKLTFKLIQTIESKGVNIAVLSSDMQKAQPPFTSIAVIYCELLKSVGITADEGDIYKALYGQGENKPSPDEIVGSVVEVITAAFPSNMDIEPAKKKAAK